MGLPNGVTRISGLQSSGPIESEVLTASQSDVFRQRFGLGVGTDIIVGIHGLVGIHRTGAVTDGDNDVFTVNSTPDVAEDRSFATIADDPDVLIMLAHGSYLVTSGGFSTAPQQFWTPEDSPLFVVHDVAVEMVNEGGSNNVLVAFLYWAYYKASQDIILDLASVSLTGAGS